ncbi:MAG: cell division protein FtsQ [Bacteroidales bacterium]|nr:cell division protein FtsQ [Bacteroidales bacterium]
MKRYIIIILDIIIAGYIVFAVTSFNNPKRLVTKCTKVEIDIADETTYGFLDAKEIKAILERKGIYPMGRRLDDISPRNIESILNHSPFVSTAQCYKTIDGHVVITVTQRSPLVRIKSERGDDYYLDENGGIMPNSKYVSDLIIVTGEVSRTFARRYISILARVIMADDFWRNNIVQINVQHDLGIEIVPRVGDHIVFLGYLPLSAKQSERDEEVTVFVREKLKRLRNFYRYGLSVAGWNKYQRIDIQYDNQIICKKHPELMRIQKPAVVVPEVHEADHPAVEAAAPPENSEHRKAQEASVDKNRNAVKTSATAASHEQKNKPSNDRKASSASASTPPAQSNGSSSTSTNQSTKSKGRTS